MKYIAILGRQPELGLAELESVLGSNAIKVVSNDVVLIDSDNSIHYQNFGSIVKFAEVTNFTISNNSEVDQLIAKFIASIYPYEEGAKLKIGISDYSNNFSSQGLLKLGLSVKKILKSSNYSVRIVPNKSARLNSAQVIHNSLVQKNGCEILLYKNGSNIQIAYTVYEQDIEGYASRDQARPMRDARVGMLPPKLAQTIINLATGSHYKKHSTLLDPFCGTGVVLQEALLMGYNVYGTDLEPRMIEYSKANLDWLKQNHPEIKALNVNLQVGDAANAKWDSFDNVACETYLGRPLSSLPEPYKLQEIIQSVNTLHKKMFANIFAQAKPGTRFCFAVPAWQTKKGFVSLPILDQLPNIGYNQLVFSHVDAKHLIYARGHQIVARQLVILEKQ